MWPSSFFKWSSEKKHLGMNNFTYTPPPPGIGLNQWYLTKAVVWTQIISAVYQKLYFDAIRKTKYTIPWKKYGKQCYGDVIYVQISRSSTSSHDIKKLIAKNYFPWITEDYWLSIGEPIPMLKFVCDICFIR